MSFIIERTAGRSVVVMHVDGSELRIGRGTNVDLRSDNPAVAFEHAVIEAAAGGYSIIDRGSITGTYVNGKAVESAWLDRGDRIEIGDLRIEVQLTDPSKPMRLSLAYAAAAGAPMKASVHQPVARPGSGALNVPRVDYPGAYSLRRGYLTRTLVAVLLVIATLAVIGLVTRTANRTAFMPGGVSPAHGRARAAGGVAIAERCEYCHTPFRPVADAQCQSCHRQAEHSRLVADEPACSSCHAEHRGQSSLAAMPGSRCLDCHADSSRHPRPVTSFGPSHPELSPLADENTLRFNHKTHLRPAGVRAGNGSEKVLECSSCHEPDLKPVNFEQHCRDCHRLTFDRRLPRAEVPHGGDPGLVYGFVTAAYAGDLDLMERTPTQLRRMLATRGAPSRDENAVLAAEQVIKTKCRQCHEVTSSLKVTPPVMRAEWFPSVKFNHGSHRQSACKSCHKAAVESASTADVLMPSRQECVECHAGDVSQNANPCTTCHQYHRSPMG